MGFVLAPIFASFALIPWFAIPSSPLFLGTLVPNESIGVGFSFFAVMISGTILGYCTELLFSIPIYLILRSRNSLRSIKIYLLAGMSGLLASFFVRNIQEFKQEELRQFALSFTSPLLGLFSGLVASLVFLLLTRKSNYCSRECT